MKIVITGATRGLGRALVAEFLKAGHQVAGCGSNPATVDAMRADHPDGVFTAVDVTREDDVAAWAGATLASLGAPDFLINNAAIMHRPAPLWEIGGDEFARVLDVNLGGVQRVIRHFTPAMIAAGRGMIVNLSSGWGRGTSPEVAPYCATKWGVEGLTKALAQELPPGLGAVPLNPGIIDTEMLRTVFGGESASYPDPETWARQAAPFILALSPADTGNSLSVDS